MGFYPSVRSKKWTAQYQSHLPHLTLATNAIFYDKKIIDMLMENMILPIPPRPPRRMIRLFHYEDDIKG